MTPDAGFLLAVPSVLAVAVYLPLWLSVEGFCFDDPGILYRLREYRATPFWATVLVDKVNPVPPSRVLTWALYRMAFRVCGAAPRRWLTIGIVCHAVNATLLLRLASHVAPLEVAVWAAALFAVHPMAVPTVASVAGVGSNLVWLGTLIGLLGAANGAWALVAAVGVATSLLKPEGWWYWAHVALWPVLLA